MKNGPKLFGLALGVALLCGLSTAWGQWRPPRSKPPSRAVMREFLQLKEVEQLIFRFTNEARRQHGLPSLDQDRELSRVAWRYSADMLHRRFFSHTNPDGLSPRDRVLSDYVPRPLMVGENLWSGSGADPGETRLLARIIVDGWMASPGHRRNLLHPRYTHLGVGVAAFGREVRATQLFVTLPSRP
ncbi:MAG: CAP domain-containing protein [Deltaproteobacteria bacterium]|nr:CAP domain-containing protein [Deltaproteobacteria bacterium]